MDTPVRATKVRISVESNSLENQLMRLPSGELSVKARSRRVSMGWHEESQQEERVHRELRDKS